MLKTIAATIALSLVLGVSACAQSSEPAATGGEAAQRLPTEQLTVETANGARRFTVEIADDDQERARGLMFRDTLADDHGMLFHFQEPQRLNFWMRNTRISLDIIFIAPDGRILNIAERTTPYSEAGVPSAGIASGVLEIRGGLAQELGIQPGDRVRHRIFPD